MRFRFAGILRKYNRPYTLVRDAGGAYVGGKWVPSPPERLRLSGVVQPVSARLRASEGGNYTDTDRMLYTVTTHASGERIEHQGVQYTVAELTEREYSDVNQYLLRRVVVNAPV
ncbi:hypothetical protein PA598K_01341 [Paenibacillus sp. 598K]|uniref:hypothetical protein n=1 Tax=Paenibacillus sp. 598K TaxID=1117987 RepID=UPI000FF9B339|nr:hypothetical protein [Paenibacillus sp. 598K]GBF73056.1 hypothetical protein PA598K_01341 [Paenibacillus sp. 598K]